MSTVKNWSKSNLSYSLLFAGASSLLGLISFNLPFVDGANSDLREIPLLISLIFITNPLYLLIVSLSSMILTPPEGSMISSYVMHLIGLVGIWYLKKFFFIRLKNKLQVALWWFSATLIYYVVFLLPSMIVSNWFVGINLDLGFFEFYTKMITLLPFEIVTTAVIVTLYAYQRELQNELLNHIVQLEKKNKQLTEYAFLNSHLLRAPLAKILGFIQLCKGEHKSSEQEEIMEKLKDSCEEFDKTVNLIGKVVASNTEDHVDLQALEEEIRSFKKEHQ